MLVREEKPNPTRRRRPESILCVFTSDRHLNRATFLRSSDIVRRATPYHARRRHPELSRTRLIEHERNGPLQVGFRIRREHPKSLVGSNCDLILSPTKNAPEISQGRFAFKDQLYLFPQFIYCGKRAVETNGNVPVQARMNSTRSIFSCGVSLSGTILSLSHLFLSPPLL